MSADYSTGNQALVSELDAERNGSERGEGVTDVADREAEHGNASRMSRICRQLALLKIALIRAAKEPDGEQGCQCVPGVAEAVAKH
jgi:hypothetical protein